MHDVLQARSQNFALLIGVHVICYRDAENHEIFFLNCEVACEIWSYGFYIFGALFGVLWVGFLASNLKVLRRKRENYFIWSRISLLVCRDFV